jgi:Rrf2 family iron-sulfur cluster assembly transcriptional regulator
MTFITNLCDVHHISRKNSSVVLNKSYSKDMLFTKSFGYALRGIIYIALKSYEKPKVQVDEIAMQLDVPKHFLGKIMKKVVKSGVLNSTRGPHGGFAMNDRTLSTSLLDLASITHSIPDLDDCVLRLQTCNPAQPCPLHYKMMAYKKDLYTLFANTTIGDLLNKE